MSGWRSENRYGGERDILVIHDNSSEPVTPDPTGLQGRTLPHSFSTQYSSYKQFKGRVVWLYQQDKD